MGRVEKLESVQFILASWHGFGSKKADDCTRIAKKISSRIKVSGCLVMIFQASEQTRKGKGFLAGRDVMC